MRRVFEGSVQQNSATIKEVSFIPLTSRVDDRGYLIEILRAIDPHFCKFGQIYIVGNMVRGVIRAFHKHKLTWDWFFISHGSAKFVLVDDRGRAGTSRGSGTRRGGPAGG